MLKVVTKNYTKTVTIQPNGWLANLSKTTRTYVLEMVAHADQGNWVLRSAGQKW